MTQPKTGKTALGIDRRTLLVGAGTALAAPMILARGAWARGKDLYVSTYTGAQGKYIADNVIPAFEKEFGCTVYQTESTTLPTISALRTEKGNPKTSVAMMDDLGIPIAKTEGLIQALPADLMPNLAKARARFVYGDGFGVGFAVSKVVPWFNTTVGYEPTSWHDLWDERYRNRFMMVTPKWTNSVMLLAMAASFVTGKPVSEAQHEISAAWPLMKELVPNVQTIHESSGNAVLQVSQGQADIAGPDFSKSIMPYVMRGAPVKMMEPVEGAFAGVNAMTLVNNAPEPELGAAFLDRMLSPEVQKGLAEATYAAPTVTGIELAAEVAAALPTTNEEIDALNSLDWSIINPQRSEIIDTFNQVFG